MAVHPAPITVDDPHAGAHGGDGAGQPVHLKHYFVSAEQQFDAAKLGMWLFLVTEILLFGGMFVAYGIYRSMYPELFTEASTQLDTVMGAINTIVLLASSLTVAWSIRAIQMGNRRLCFWLLTATVLLAGMFMVIKYFEYTHKFHLGIFPGAHYTFFAEGTPFTLPGVESAMSHGGGEHHLPEGEVPLSNQRAGLFFSIYYVMTGIHGIHVLIGMIAITILAVKTRRGRYSDAWYTPIENVGLYWHVVDVIWIFLFPLMYLI